MLNGFLFEKSKLPRFIETCFVFCWNVWGKSGQCMETSDPIHIHIRWKKDSDILRTVGFWWLVLKWEHLTFREKIRVRYEFRILLETSWSSFHTILLLLPCTCLVVKDNGDVGFASWIVNSTSYFQNKYGAVRKRLKEFNE